MFDHYYKNIASLYDRRWKHYTDNTLDKVIQYFPDALENKTILDFGCGTGELIKRLLVANPDLAQVTGYDLTEEMLQQAQKKIQQFPEHISRKVKLQDHKDFETRFDIIVSTSVFHYLPQPHAELINLKSLLQKDGFLILLDYTKNGLLAKYFEWVIKRVDAMHQKAYAPHQIREMVESAGFNINKSEEFKITPLWRGAMIKATV